MSPSRLWRSKPLRKHLVYPHNILWMYRFPEFPVEIVVLSARACEPLWIGILVPESTLALVDCSMSYLCIYDICRDWRSRKFFPGEKKCIGFIPFKQFTHYCHKFMTPKKCIFRNICLCKCRKIRVFWRNFFASKAAVADFCYKSHVYICVIYTSLIEPLLLPCSVHFYFGCCGGSD